VPVLAVPVAAPQQTEALVRQGRFIIRGKARHFKCDNQQYDKTQEPGSARFFVERIDGPRAVGSDPEGRGVQWTARADAVPVRSIRPCRQISSPWSAVEARTHSPQAGNLLRPSHGQKNRLSVDAGFHVSVEKLP
jgi:hypothetical protein